MDRYESWVDRQIREAQERGEFDNLRGAGQPIPGLKDRPDENWWVKGLIEREGIKPPLPPAMALRKEVAELPATVASLRDEAAVREVADDLNARVLDLRRRPSGGPPVFVAGVDVEQVVAGWRAAAAERSPDVAAPAPTAGTPATGRGRRQRPARRWSRLRP